MVFSMAAVQKKQRSGDDAHSPGNDLPRQLFMQEHYPENDHQRHAQFVNRGDLGDITALQCLEVEQPRDAGGDTRRDEKRDGFPSLSFYPASYFNGKGLQVVVTTADIHPHESWDDLADHPAMCVSADQIIVIHRVEG